MRFLLSLLILLQIPLNPPGGGTPNRFHAVADWTLTPNDRDWLEHYHLPARFEEARSMVSWAEDVPAPELREYAFEVRLHPTVFVGTGGQIIAGEAQVPGFIEAAGLLPLRIDIAWDRELSQKVVLSHEFAHLVALFTNQPGWEQFGHGTPGDPFLKKLTSWAHRVYIPSHSYDPFKAGVL